MAGRLTSNSSCEALYSQHMKIIILGNIFVMFYHYVYDMIIISDILCYYFTEYSGCLLRAYT